MTDFVFNISKGRVNEMVRRVVGNDPAPSGIVVVALSVTGDQDAAMQDADTLAALLALPNVAEVTNTNYARLVLTDVDLVNPAVDDGNDRQEADMPDLTFATILAGDAWTDLVACYDPDTGSGTDADLIPLTLQDYPMTPDGSDLIATINAAGFFRAA